MKTKLFTLLVALITTTSLWAYDFQYGDLYYNITSKTTVEVTYLEEYSSENYSGLTTATIPETVTCNGTTYSVTSIGYVAFRACSSLTSITIPNSVTDIGFAAFSDCISLTSITIPNHVTSIGEYAFFLCSSLTSITIPNSVTSIGFMTFYDCSSLTSVTIGNSVTSIGDRAFGGCRNLTSITCEAETPPTVGEYAFDGVSESIPVYVPCGYIEAYQTGWYIFFNIRGISLYSIEISTSNSQMGFARVDYQSCDDVEISAEPNYGYHFVRWSDGNTDNPRSLELTRDTVLTAEFAQTFSGQCGDNLYWNYKNNTLTISGSGDMYDDCPWGLFAAEINDVVLPNAMTYIGYSAFYGCSSLASITIPNSVTSIGSYVFRNCSALTSVTIPNSVTSIGSSAFCNCEKLGTLVLGDKVNEIGDGAFYGCNKLYHIYCYAPEPPMAYERSFANYNVNLYVPCNYLDNYKYDRVFGSFRYIQCIESEDVTTNDVVVNPGANDVTITWPTEDNANSYTIVIEKDGEVFCTLTFNAEGKLLNIAFAPGRNGNHPTQYAEQAGKGYRFTVTSLESCTKYGYNIDVKDASNKTIKSHSGEFTTQSTTAVDNITTNNANIQKIMRDGQLIIIRNGVEYNAVGQEM